MRLQSCLNPKSITNKYTGERSSVRCGKCSACCNIRVSQWVQRLDIEAKCHKYVLFATLTYDDFNVPQIVRLRSEDSPRNCFTYIDIQTSQIFETYEIKRHFTEADKEFCKNSKVVNVLSKRDFQLFIKRLRYYFQQEDKTAFLRYYLTGEYGPRTYRPHGHLLLFFDSEKCADRIQILLSKAWTFGTVYDPHFVEGSAAKYVSSYINSTSVLPALYEHSQLRQFSIFSKSPAIGSLFPATREIRDIFFRGDNTFRVFSSSSRKFVDVPFWKSFEARLYPRCQRFGALVSSDRVALYRLIQKFPSSLNAVEIASRIKSEYIDSGRTDFFSRYFREIAFICKPGYRFVKDVSVPRQIKDLPFVPNYPISQNFVAFRQEIKEFNMNCLISFVRTLRRVQYQSHIFGITIEDYVHKIEDYYENLEKDRFFKTLRFQNEYFKTHPKWHAIYFDIDFYYMVQSVEYVMLSDSYRNTLKELFNGNIPLTSDGFVDIPPLERLNDYQSYKVMQDKIFHDLVKQKENNSYAMAKKDKFGNIIKYQNSIQK